MVKPQPNEAKTHVPQNFQEQSVMRIHSCKVVGHLRIKTATE